MPGQPPPLKDEVDLLLAYVAQQRDGLRYAAHGLRDDQLALTPTAGSLSIGGLLKHAADMERNWAALVRQVPYEVDYLGGFTVGPDDTVAGLVADLEAAGRETEATIRSVGLDDAVPVPKGVPWFPADVDAWTVRWVALHLIEELARHAGHADIVRESIDGATMHPLMAAVEGWPETEWLTPWRPAA
jgi:hypothetical protein